MIEDDWWKIADVRDYRSVVCGYTLSLGREHTINRMGMPSGMESEALDVIQRGTSYLPQSQVPEDLVRARIRTWEEGALPGLWDACADSAEGLGPRRAESRRNGTRIIPLAPAGFGPGHPI